MGQLIEIIPIFLYPYFGYVSDSTFASLIRANVGDSVVPVFEQKVTGGLWSESFVVTVRHFVTTQEEMQMEMLVFFASLQAKKPIKTFSETEVYPTD